MQPIVWGRGREESATRELHDALVSGKDYQTTLTGQEWR